MMRSKSLWPLASIAVLGLALGCGTAEQPSEAPGAAPAEPFDEATAGNITGRIVLEGTPPAAEVIRMDSDPVCMREVTDTPYTQFFIVGDEGGLANVFVYVKDGLGDRTFPRPSEPVVLDQDGCQYIPHVFGVQVGQPLEVVNSDPTLHNVNAQPRVNQGFNTGQPIQGMRFSHTFTQPEVMVPFRCDVHGWMNAYAGVLPHPYFSVSDTSGTFDIRTLPPGTYTLEAWHEKLGTQEMSVTIGENETAEVTFTFNMTT